MTKYIWHTQEDDKVRPWHASRDGKVFDSEHPPKGGNPGESPNCRCWAEPIEENKGKTYLLFDGQTERDGEICESESDPRRCLAIVRTGNYH